MLPCLNDNRNQSLVAYIDNIINIIENVAISVNEGAEGTPIIFQKSYVYSR
ncbi:hypothetical protein SAMN02745163_03835 [Clostridium cavendishii DSM 21758]|uniref:Uncharacterized protein n=1 Tax=Clostridium cavendishii DSM 21758 TaxID=1121302 RepID=A0A1M6SKM1_9CLOT|nr:hypothetical protein [Clostridium cavendishii]SHK45196.1 hypothetical protein SAMN02745163_03835 [Clostridium cavendishii DSM 21758]